MAMGGFQWSSFHTTRIADAWHAQLANANGWVGGGDINPNADVALTAAGTLAAATTPPWQFQGVTTGVRIAHTTGGVGAVSFGAFKYLPLVFPFHTWAVMVMLFRFTNAPVQAAGNEALGFYFKNVNLGTARFKGMRLRLPLPGTNNWQWEVVTGLTGTLVNADQPTFTGVNGWISGSNNNFNPGEDSVNNETHMLAMWFQPDDTFAPSAVQLDGHHINFANSSGFTITENTAARNIRQKHKFYVVYENHPGGVGVTRGIDLDALFVLPIHHNEIETELLRYLEANSPLSPPLDYERLAEAIARYVK